MRAPVHSQKHYVQNTRGDVTTLARVSTTLVTAVESTAANLVNEVSEGSVVKAVYIEQWLYGSANDQAFVFNVLKLPGGLGSPTYADMVALGNYDNKKNILFTSQGLLAGDSAGSPTPVIRTWIKIPKGKQRFGLGDKLVFTLASTGDATVHFCGFATYKEYS